MNYYIKYNSNVNPWCFTVCSSIKCKITTCQRNKCNHTKEDIFSVANLYLDCDSYQTDTNTDSKDKL